METVTQTFSVANLYLQASADTIYNCLIHTTGIITVHVSLSERNVVVEYQPDIITPEQIAQKIKSCGYHAYTHEYTTNQFVEDHLEVPEPNYRNVFVLLIVMVIVLILWLIKLTPWIALLLSVYAMYIGRSLFMHAGEEIKKHNPSTAVLSSLAVIISLIYGIYLATQNLVSAYPFILSIIAILASSMYKTKYLKYMQAISKQSYHLNQYIPESTSVYKNYTETISKTTKIQKNQILIIRPNEIIPVDGIVIDGYAAVDESTLTGLDSTSTKAEGSNVYAGTRCIHGSLQIRAEKIGEKTTLLQFAKLAKETANDKSFDSPFKNFSRYLFFYAIITAIVLFAGWLLIGRSLSNTLSIVVAVLASVAMNALTIASEKEVLASALYAAKKHILFRSVDALEMAGKTETIFLEQDDIIMQAKPEVTDFLPLQQEDSSYMRYIVYKLSNKRHDVYSLAISRYLKTHLTSSTNREDITRLQNNTQNNTYKLTNVKELSVIDDTCKQLLAQGKTVFLLQNEENKLGIVAFAKPLLTSSIPALDKIKQNAEIHLFTNSSQEEQHYIQQETHITHIHQVKNREEKDAIIQACTHDEVTMYAGTLANTYHPNVDIHTHFGISSDLSDRNKDIIITRNRLDDLAQAMQISAMLNQRIQFDQILIIVYHVIAVLLFGFLIPIFFDLPLPVILPCISSIGMIHFLFRKHTQQ